MTSATRRAFVSHTDLAAPFSQERWTGDGTGAGAGTILNDETLESNCSVDVSSGPAHRRAGSSTSSVITREEGPSEGDPFDFVAEKVRKSSWALDMLLIGLPLL